MPTVNDHRNYKQAAAAASLMDAGKRYFSTVNTQSAIPSSSSSASFRYRFPLMADHGRRRRGQALADISNIATNKRQGPPEDQSTGTPANAFKRLQAELMDLVINGESGISAFPTEDNIFCWKGTITGSKGTVFDGEEYKFSISFPRDYPFKPPKVTFTNVDVIGLVILQDKWSCVYGVRTILISIQSLLAGSPLNIQTAGYGVIKKHTGNWWTSSISIKKSPLQKM